ncbi:MAG: chain-length determining protein [Bacteroidaceae bacterium]|nr:chain-length determining protein [Bacteroidaceae bacterium]
MAEQNNKLPKQEQTNEIDIVEYIAKLWKKRPFIIKWGCVGIIFGLIVAFSLPEKYKASVILAPEAAGNNSSAVSGLASMMGMSIDNSTDAISVEMFPDVAHSTPFIVGLFDIPVQFERKDSVIKTTLYEYMLKYQKKPWWSPIIKAPAKALKWCKSLIISSQENEESSNGQRNLATLTKKERRVVSYFAENIQVNIDKKTGMARIEMEMQDPLVVYTVVQTVMNHLKDYVSDYRTSKVRQDIENLTIIYNQRKNDYYEAQQAYVKYVDANKNVIRQSAQAEQERLQQEMNLAYQIYSQVATQLESARIKEQETKPVFVVLEPASVPNLKSRPSKAKLLILFTFLAGCCAAGWALFEDDVKEIVKEITEEK